MFIASPICLCLCWFPYTTFFNLMPSFCTGTCRSISGVISARMSVVGSSAGVFCLTLLFLGLSFTSPSAFLLTTEYWPDHTPMVIFVDGCVREFFVFGEDVGGGGGLLFTLCVDVCS